MAVFAGIWMPRGVAEDVMNSEKLYSDEFENDVYNDVNWSAKWLSSKSSVMEELNSLRLEGRVIKHMRFVSYVYSMRRDDIEEYVYNALENQGFTPDEVWEGSQWNSIQEDFPVYAFAEIDEPLLIWFEDDDHFGIDAPSDGMFRMSMNHIPYGIMFGINSPNILAEDLFPECLGRTIVCTEVVPHDPEKPFAGLPRGPVGTPEDDLAEAVILWLDSGIGIHVEGWVDYCHVRLVDSRKEMLSIPFSRIKESAYNYEDLHEDEKLGFYGRGSMFSISKKVEKVSDNYFIVEIPGKDRKLYIIEEDSSLFCWAMTIAKGKMVYFGLNVDFTYDEWMRAVDAADRIVSFETYEELCAFLMSFKESTNGAVNFESFLRRDNDFWRHIESYRCDAYDLRNWSGLVIKPGDTVRVRAHRRELQ